MPYGLYISAEGAQVQSRRMEVIANNIANVDTVGFKRDLAVMQSRYAEAIERGAASPGAGTINDVGGGVQFRETVTDFSPGPLQEDRNPQRRGPAGRRLLRRPKGQERLLTRAGNFHLTAAGDLVTQQGYPVLGEGNAPIALNPDGGAWEIDSSGSVNQGTHAAAIADRQAGVVGRPGQERREPLSPVDRRSTGSPGERAVSGGYLEMAAVQPTTEMTTMIETSRILEANVNVMKTHNEMLQSLIERVLKA